MGYIDFSLNFQNYVSMEKGEVTFGDVACLHVRRTHH
jgi:hypothetical protein